MKFNKYGVGGENPGSPAPEVNNAQVLHVMADATTGGPFCSTSLNTPDTYNEYPPSAFGAGKQS